MNTHGFSDSTENLCLAWDATRLSQYMRCPLTYKWKYIDSFRTPKTNPALNFGTCWHEAAGEFDRALALGADRDAALLQAIRKAIELGYQYELLKDGAKGDAAKRCIWALVRALIWWEQDTAARRWSTVKDVTGEPAIEVRFLLPLGAYALTGEEFMLCGSFDAVVEEDGDYWVLERKTTAQSIGSYFWQTYDPCMQTYLYDYVAPQLFPNKKFRGVIVEALQTGVEFARSESHRIVRTDEQRIHWREVMLYWIRRAEQDAINNTWTFAMNSESSTYGSIYKDIQKRDPRVWPQLLHTDLEKGELWNPADMTKR